VPMRRILERAINAFQAWQLKPAFEQLAEAEAKINDLGLRIEALSKRACQAGGGTDG